MASAVTAFYQKLFHKHYLFDFLSFYNLPPNKAPANFFLSILFACFFLCFDGNLYGVSADVNLITTDLFLLQTFVCVLILLFRLL
jgi:hypothetical protein